MELTPLGLEGAWLASSPVWADTRGNFREWFKITNVMEVTGLDFSVAQANLSESMCGVVRGIHYSVTPVGQAKWVTCISGAIKDVVVDLRNDSATYGRYVAVDLVNGDGRAILISHGLGHGFVAKEDGTKVAYLVTSPYSPTEEFEINPLDPEIGIDWGFPIERLLLSPKDAAAPTLKVRALEGNLPAGL